MIPWVLLSLEIKKINKLVFSTRICYRKVKKGKYLEQTKGKRIQWYHLPHNK